MVALQDRTWTRSKELELADAVSILQVEPERLGDMWAAYDLLKEANKQKLDRLNNQIDLFEAERCQLVEAAFKANKEAKTIESNLTDVVRQRNSLRELLENETQLKNKYYMSCRSLVFYQSLSVIALLVVLVLTIYAFV